jgi:hypothetical protein
LRGERFVHRYSDVSVVIFTLSGGEMLPDHSQREAATKTSVFEDHPVEHIVRIEAETFADLVPLAELLRDFEEYAGEHSFLGVVDNGCEPDEREPILT